MVSSEIRKFSNENEFRAIISTITENDYFVVGAIDNKTICKCNNYFVNCDTNEKLTLCELCELVKGTTDLVIERNYYFNN